MIVIDSFKLKKASNITSSAESKLRRLLGADVEVRFVIKDEVTKIDYSDNTVMETIINTVSDYFELDADVIKGKGRESFKADARCICYALIIEYMKPIPSLKKIGIEFSGRDHTTVIHALKKFKDMYDTEEIFRQRYRDITQILDFKFNNKRINNEITEINQDKKRP